MRLDFIEDHEKRLVARANNWRVIDEKGRFAKWTSLR